MAHISRSTLLIAFCCAVLWGCDATDPAAATDVGAARATSTAVGGSVFVNSGEGGQPRVPTELGIEQVWVEVYAPGATEPTATALTNANGRYQVSVPAGTWIVRVPEAGPAGSFNAALFSTYTTPDSEREVVVGGPATRVEFGFDPQLGAILEAIEDGPYQTRGRTLEAWAQLLSDADEPDDCTGGDAPICTVAAYLDTIFSTGQAGDTYFGNPEPFVLPAGLTPLQAALQILTSTPGSDTEEVRVELFVAELNYLAGLGSPNPLFDQTTLYYFEEYVLATLPASAAAGRISSLASIQLDILSAYNRGGGGGQGGE